MYPDVPRQLPILLKKLEVNAVHTEPLIEGSACGNLCKLESIVGFT